LICISIKCLQVNFCISKMWHVLCIICNIFYCLFHVFLVHILPHFGAQIVTCSISYGLWPHVGGLNEQNKYHIISYLKFAASHHSVPSLSAGCSSCSELQVNTVTSCIRPVRVSDVLPNGFRYISHGKAAVRQSFIRSQSAFFKTCLKRGQMFQWTGELRAQSCIVIFVKTIFYL